MAFIATERALFALEELPVALEKIRGRDNALAIQILTAAQSVALNLEEGSWKSGRDRLNRYRIAAGSASEARTGLRMARALLYVTQEEIMPAVGYFDEVLAIMAKILGLVRRVRQEEERQEKEEEK